jgi:Leucine-rich repeat (LRR) protein
MDRQNGGEDRRMSKKSLSARIEDARKSKAAELDLSREGLSQLPKSLGQLSQLQQLDLSGNQLTAVPEVLGQLSRLCRKVGFWRQNPKIGSRKINHLRVSTFLFSVICDRAARSRGTIPATTKRISPGRSCSS